jgi:hypothetical protein
MKKRLGALVVAYMRCTSLDSDARKIDQDLSALARSATAEGRKLRYAQDSQDPLNYGYQFAFHARASNDERRLISITAEFQIRCGSDKLLFVFAPKNGTWLEVLRWQSKPYEDVAGAFWAFDYAISPPDEIGNWYVVTKHVTPWCTSNWRTVRYSVLRPAVNSSAPREVFAGSDSIYLGDDDFGNIAAEKSAFELKFQGASIDPGIHNRIRIKRFNVSSDKITRARPIARSPRDFVDEWIVSSWNDARAWSSKNAINALRQMHDRLHKLDLFEYESIHRCADAPDRRQVALRHEDSKTFYFNVVGDADFLMKSVSEASDPICAGENILRKTE